MSRTEPKKKLPAADPAPAPEESGNGRSGSGANTALTAMLKKRRMRASHDSEAGDDEEPPRKIANE